MEDRKFYITAVMRLYSIFFSAFQQIMVNFFPAIISMCLLPQNSSWPFQATLWTLLDVTLLSQSYFVASIITESLMGP
jgi:hypothetical protein